MSCVHVHTQRSPGVNAEDDVDDKVFECCSDADVLVYVADGTTTFETTVSSSVDIVRARAACHYTYMQWCFHPHWLQHTIYGMYHLS